MLYKPNAEWTQPFPPAKAFDVMTPSEAALAAEAAIEAVAQAIAAVRDVYKYAEGTIITDLKITREKFKAPLIRMRLRIQPRQLRRLMRADARFVKLPPQVSYE